MGKLTVCPTLICSWPIAGGETRPRMSPARFLVDSIVGDAAQPADQSAVDADRASRKCRARRFFHERHELVRESGHGAGDANAADVRATADAAHPAAFGHVAVDHRTPTADLN